MFSLIGLHSSKLNWEWWLLYVTVILTYALDADPITTHASPTSQQFVLTGVPAHDAIDIMQGDFGQSDAADHDTFSPSPSPTAIGLGGVEVDTAASFHFYVFSTMLTMITSICIVQYKSRRPRQIEIGSCKVYF